MYTFKELRKAAKISPSGPAKRVAILGNCATQFLALALRGYAALEKLPIEVFDADYNQIDAQLLDTDSEVYRFHPESILIWLATDKLYEEFLDLPLEARNGFADSCMERIERYWTYAEQNCKARILQFNFTELDDKVLGQYSCKVPAAFVYQIRKLNFLLEEAMAKHSNVYPIDLLAIQVRLGQENFYDRENDRVYFGASVYCESGHRRAAGAFWAHPKVCGSRFGQHALGRRHRR